jgi:hypothetical protein
MDHDRISKQLELEIFNQSMKELTIRESLPIRTLKPLRKYDYFRISLGQHSGSQIYITTKDGKEIVRPLFWADNLFRRMLLCDSIQNVNMIKLDEVSYFLCDVISNPTIYDQETKNVVHCVVEMFGGRGIFLKHVKRFDFI